jgi:uncharacterized protein (TIGR02265 family)
MAKPVAKADLAGYHRLEMSAVSVDLSAALAQLQLERRLEDVPSGAMVRGVFFNLIDVELRRRGMVLPVSVKPSTGWRSYAFYSTRSLLKTYATAGALVDRDPLEGVRQLFRGGAGYFSSTWFGRTFQRFLKPDPTAAFRWIERSREHVANYGHWRLEHRGPGKVVMHMFDEYFWIEAAQRGGCEGLLEACGVEGEVFTELDGPFDGRVFVSWTVRN